MLRLNDLALSYLDKPNHKDSVIENVRLQNSTYAKHYHLIHCFFLLIPRT